MTRVLLALTSHERLGETGRTTGFYVSEAAHPFRVFTEAGYQVDFVSVQGGRPPRDGTKPGDAEVTRFLAEQEDRLSTTRRPEDIDPGRYDALLFVGGHGTMWDFPGCDPLAAVAARIYDRGGVVAAVCHGPAGLVNLQLSDGSYLVSGKRVSAFTNDEERAVGLAGVVPFLLQTALQDRGAVFTQSDRFTAHAVADDRLVTSRNPASAVRVAELVVEELARVRPASVTG